MSALPILVGLGVALFVWRLVFALFFVVTLLIGKQSRGAPPAIS